MGNVRRRKPGHSQPQHTTAHCRMRPQQPLPLQRNSPLACGAFQRGKQRGSLLFQIFLIIGKECGSPGNMSSGARVDFLHQRQYLMTQLIAGILHFPVAFVLPEQKCLRQTIAFNLRTAACQKRAADIPTHRAHPRQPMQPRPPAKAHQERFRLIIPVVRNGNISPFPCRFAECGIAQKPPRFFLAHTALFRLRCHIIMVNLAGHAPIRAKALHKRLIPVRRRAAQTMVDMDSRKRPALPLPPAVQDMQQGNGICPAGYPDNNLRPLWEHMVFFQHRLHFFPHVCRPPCFPPYYQYSIRNPKKAQALSVLFPSHMKKHGGIR